MTLPAAQNRKDSRATATVASTRWFCKSQWFAIFQRTLEISTQRCQSNIAGRIITKSKAHFVKDGLRLYGRLTAASQICRTQKVSVMSEAERNECTPPPSCSTCVHFEQANPYRWGLCKHPLPWWVDSNSPTVQPYNNNAKDCDCYMPND